MVYNARMNTLTTLQPIIDQARIKRVPKGQMILYEGDLPREVYMVKSGIIKIHDIDDNGNEKILHLLKAGGLFPLAFFSGSTDPTRWFYTALTSTELYVVPQDNLRDYMKHHPDKTIELMNWFSREVHELLVRLSSLGKTTTIEKLQAALIFLAVCHGESEKRGWQRIPFPISHQLLADMIGVTRESTALVMKELQKSGYIRYPKLTTLEINIHKLTEGK